jgi:4-amino-4-deoxy-L-arabinose transferase-like glycosyltransferase
VSRLPRPPASVKTAARRPSALSAAPAAPSSSEPPAPAVEAAPDEPPAPLASWAELWRAHWVPLVVVFHLALAARWVVLAEVWASPYAAAPNIDSAAYEAFAHRLLGDGEWLPARAFYQSPFYGYVLAIVYRLAGDNAWSPRVVQTLLGAWSCAVAYAAGARLYSRRAGWIAGLALALYGPVIVEDVLIVKTAWVIAASLTAFALLLRYGPAARPRGVAGAGLLLGVAIVAGGQWVPALGTMAFAAATLPEAARRDRRRRLALAFALAAALPVGALSAWNSWHGGGFLLTSADAGLNLFMGNNPLATGLPARPPGLRDVPEFEESDARRIAEREAGTTLTLAGVSRHWSRRATDFMRDDPGAWFVVTVSKFRVLWNAYELPDDSHYSFLRARWLPALRGMLTFAWVAPLGLAGLLLGPWRDRRHRALLLMIVPYLGVLLLFYVRSRYRLPAVPFLALAGAGLVDRAATDVARRAWRPVAIAGAVVAAAALLVNQRYCEPAQNGSPALCLEGEAFYDQEWQMLANHWIERGDRGRTLLALEAAARVRGPRGPGIPQYRLATALQQEGERYAAAGDVACSRGAWERASALLRAAAAAGYRPAQMWTAYGEMRQRLEDWAGARDAFARASDLDPDSAVAVLRLARLDAQTGRCVDAVAGTRMIRSGDAETRAQVAAIDAECAAVGVTPRPYPTAAPRR